MRLLDYIRPGLVRPLSKLGIEASNAYEALPGELDCRPGSPGEAASRVLSYGVPFAVIGENPSFERMIRSSIPSILKSGKMERHAWGVMHAGALLRRLGSRVEFLKENRKSRMPDIRARWDEEAPVDCEVTTPDVKKEQAEFEKVLKTLTLAIGTNGRNWHVLIHLEGIPDAKTQDKIINTAFSLRPDQEDGIQKRWHVRAVSMESGAALEGGAPLDAWRPAWWDDGPTLNSSSVSLGNGGRLRIFANLSFVSYLNSIEGKVWSRQRDPNNPYVIVVDQGAGRAMPMRHERLAQELTGYLPMWKHVAAILLFDYRPVVLGPFYWKLSLHINAAATLQAPKALVSLIPRDKVVCVNPFE